MLLDPGLLIGVAALLAAPAFAVLWLGHLYRRAKRTSAALERALTASQGRAALRPDASRAEAILEALPDPVGEIDRAGRVVCANGSFAGLMPAGSADAPPTVLERTRPEPAPDDAGAAAELVSTPAGPRWFAWRETERIAPDGTSTRLRIGREITDRVAAERALEEARARAEDASAAKSRFLATVSHEFRTPLAGILGMSDLILDTGLDPEQLSYVQALRTSAEALGSLIEEILDFSRIEAGRIDLAEDEFEIEPLVQGVVELLAPRAQDKGIEVSCFVASDAPARVRGDRDRLRQILFNLVGNAVKFTARGGVGVTVEPGRDGGLTIAVADTGPGIPADRLPHIFDEFDQGGLRTTREAGTGLGLAITRRLVERMSGAVAVESVVNRGSVFRVTLPLPAADGTAAAPPPVPAGTRALIVADSPFEANYLARRLGEAGLRATRVGTHAEATALLGHERFDAVIADGSCGPDEARWLADAARSAGATRIVVLLSPFEKKQFGSHRAAGFDSYLTKPVRTRSLLERLGEGPAAVAVANPAADARAETPRVGKLRVLLAEDNDVNALLAVKSLQKLGAIVDWARDGTEALARGEAALSGEAPPYDLILMDMRMPGLDGFEVTRRLRERETALGRDERCRIVALTASLHGQEARLRETAGFDGFLAKPFTPAALARELTGPDGTLATTG